MKSQKGFQPEWREDVPAPRSYRSIFKYAPDKFKHPSPAWVEMFRAEFGMTDDDFRKRQPGGDEQVVLSRKPSLGEAQINAFANIVGAENVAADDYSRIRFGHGKSLDEDLALRRGETGNVPDLIIHPRDKQDVARIVAYCDSQRIPIITYGAGSGVVLGMRASKGGIAVVMKTHMNKLLSLNDLNQTAVVQPGMMGPDFERALNDAPQILGAKRRYTCGHFPQSFELASVGGWIMALGAGQASTYYGDACDLVLSQEYVTPAGVFRTSDVPAYAAGPKVNDIMKGSEGAFGILVEATMKVFRYAPENRRRFAFMFPSWDAAVDAMREIAQGEFGRPAVLRISDPEETEIGLKLKGFSDGLFDKFLRGRGFKPMERCLCIGTAEGEAGFAARVKSMSSKISRSYGAMSLTGYATKQWEHGRYSDVHIREDLLDYGIIIDTLETGVTWDNLHRLRREVRFFVKSRPGTICLTHASHFYPQGTNLYFIFMMRPKDPGEFSSFRAKVVDRIVANGGSISHHHGVGRMFAPWMERFVGPEQLAVLRALKRHFDPNDIMNPGGTLGLDPPEQSFMRPRAAPKDDESRVGR
ncbi:MAG TPA: FAD-binding oxidoreductase [Candidatus Brocadiia bacterium]|nr:FAD-binding oxidoreductase [Candidatus Brocadiia bacterium]